MVSRSDNNRWGGGAPLLSIGEMAAANGVSTRLLRYYQELGLIEPAHIDKMTGHRFYDLLQSDAIDMVRELQGIGLTLDEIVAIVTSGSLRGLHDAVLSRRDMIVEEIRRLEIARDIAMSMVESIERFQGNDITDQILFERAPASSMVVFDIPAGMAPQDDVRKGREEWERVLRFVKAEMIERDYPLELFRNISCAVPCERVVRGDHRATYAFVRLTQEMEAYVQGATPIPAGLYLVYYGREMYLPSGEGFATHLIPRFLDYAQAKDLEICGDYYEEILCRWPLLLGDSQKLFRVSVQVRPRGNGGKLKEIGCI